MEMKKPPFGDKPPMGMPPMGSPGGPPAGGFVPPTADISWVKRKFLDVPYDTKSPRQCFDLYLPDEGDDPFPLLIHIHGGAFAFGDKRDDHVDAYLTGIRRGYAVASIEYRVSGEATFPAAVLDCREAIRYTKSHAEEYKLDGNRVIVIGGSAGGNLASMIGMPRFLNEEVSVFVSLANPYHLQDVPRVRTYVNAYTATRTTIRLAIEKLMGKSAFKGISPVDAFCGLPDTVL